MLLKLNGIKCIYHCVYAKNNANQYLEIFVIDKNKQEGVYAKLASQLSNSAHLSVVIINAVSMIAYRATKQQIIDSFDMNDSINHIIMRKCAIDGETAEKMSLYFSKSHATIAAFIGCTFDNFSHKIIFNGFSCINTLQILFFHNTNIDDTTANALSKVIANNTKLILVDIFNCNLQKGAGTIAAALKNTSTITTLSLSDNKIPGSVADDLAVAIYVNCNLERLRLADNNLHHHAAAIASALCQIRTLVELNFNNNNMTEKVADELSLAIENNKSLQVLRIGGNDLKSNGVIRISLSISRLSKLRMLAINDNQITEEAADSIAVAICNNKQLTELNLNNNLLRKGVDKIANALHAHNIPLESLGLSSNEIPEEAANALADAIKNNCLLEVLNLSNNNLYTGGVITIAKSLANLSSLKSLNFSSNKTGSGAADAIASVILANSWLDTLYLYDNHLETGVNVIANALKQISGLKKLNLNDNRIPECAGEDLAGAILSNKSLQVVQFANNNLKTKGIVAISRALSNLTELQTFSTFNNYCTGEASDAIALAISSNVNLKTIYVCENNLQAGVTKIANALNHVSVKELNFRDSNISESAASEFAVTISNQHCLEKLVLDCNHLGTNGILTLTRSLHSLNTLKLLNLDNTSLTEEAADAIALALLSNHGLEQLYLGNNKLRAGAIKVARALKSISTLQILDLNDNHMPAGVADELASAITCNSSLKQLRVRNNKITTNGMIKLQTH